MPRKDYRLKAGSITFHLRFDPRRHIFLRSSRNMTIRPCRVLTGGRARRIEQTLLSQQNKGFVVMLSTPCRAFRRSDLVERSAQMNGRRLRTIRVPPGDRRAESPIDLENPRAMAKS